MLKIFVLLLLGSAVIESTLSPSKFGEKFAKLASELHNRCMSRYNIDPADIQKMANGNFDVSDKDKNYVICLWKESTVIDDNAVINYALIEEFVIDEVAADVLITTHICDEQTPEKNVNKKVWAMVNCVYRLNPDVFVML